MATENRWVISCVNTTAGTAVISKTAPWAMAGARVLVIAD
jgi:hypothetical protein